jgi:hypothetical protein
VRYFLIRASSVEDVQQAMQTGRWSTAAQNLNGAYRAGDVVLLLFAVHKADAFVGYARMVSEAVPVPPRSAAHAARRHFRQMHANDDTDA